MRYLPCIVARDARPCCHHHRNRLNEHAASQKRQAPVRPSEWPNPLSLVRAYGGPILLVVVSPVESPVKVDHSDLKVWLWLRQDGKCFLCGELIDLTIPRNKYGACSCEHLIPKVRGGTDCRNNLAATHWECNKKRGTGRWLKQMRPPQGLVAPYRAMPADQLNE